MKPRDRVRIARRGFLWIAKCSACTDRLQSPFLRNVHTIAMRHVESHRADQEGTK